MTVDQYLAKLPDDRRSALSALRNVVREMVPEATEEIAYGMPSYRYHGGLCAFASQKNHMSLYVMSAGTPLARLREQTNLDIGKGCVRFKRLDEVPLALLRDVLAEAAHANRERAGAAA